MKAKETCAQAISLILAVSAFVLFPTEPLLGQSTTTADGTIKAVHRKVIRQWLDENKNWRLIPQRAQNSDDVASKGEFEDSVYPGSYIAADLNADTIEDFAVIVRDRRQSGKRGLIVFNGPFREGAPLMAAFFSSDLQDGDELFLTDRLIVGPPESDNLLILRSIGDSYKLDVPNKEQESRVGTVAVGRQIKFQLGAWDAVGSSVKIAIAPEGAVEATLKDGMLRIRGLIPGSAVITVSGNREEGLEKFSESFSVVVEPGKVRNYSSPKNVRDYFMLLPDDFFVLEGCEWETDQDCEHAKREYLRSFLITEDTKNGYLKAGCDGAQSCLELTIFRRSDGTHLVGLNVSAEDTTVTRFLYYRNSGWTDVSTEVVPNFRESDQYELPRFGTTVTVFEQAVYVDDEGIENVVKGRKLYDLEWNGHSFSVRVD